MNYLSKYHTYIILIILVVSVTLLGLGIKETYIDYYQIKSSKTPFSQIFSIDNQIKSEPQYIQWKSYWRKNYSKFGNNLDKLFQNRPFQYNPRDRLLYDGVRDLNYNCI